MEANMDEFAIKVEYSQDNLMKCKCGQCPVQGDSQCAMDGMRELQDMMESSADPPPPPDAPVLYCGQGTASCHDLDFSQTCICSSCQVWSENGLGSWKYCKSGSASEIG